jgi:hypothetical protein
MKPEPRPIRVTLQPAEEKDTAVPGEVRRVSPLWLGWLAIAHEHASEAREHAGPPELGSPEWRAAMVAVTSAAFALDGLYGAVKPLVNPPASGAPRQRQILEGLKLGFQLGSKPHQWLPEVDWLDEVRDLAVHHGEEPRPQVGHPEIADLHIAVESRDFSAAYAERAVALVLDVVKTCFASPKPSTQEWVELRRPVVNKVLANLGS